MDLLVPLVQKINTRSDQKSHVQGATGGAMSPAAADAEAFGDLLDGVAAFAVVALHLVQRAGHLHAVGVQGRRAPADAAARSGLVVLLQT
ncbi:hypothetical protein AB0K40_33970 [Nonomuraea bangladeshensis]|uniref:Uncharacterized protein n=1 Tax=Nonomuraea bangladeshensis TaxID=404385 RepID=A0ABV3HDD2_9ACTN